MSEHKKNPTKHMLGSSEVEGQGTTNREFDGKSKDSSRRKKKRT